MTVTAIRNAVVNREEARWRRKVGREREAWNAAKKAEADLEKERLDKEAAEQSEGDFETVEGLDLTGLDNNAAEELVAYVKRLGAKKKVVEQPKDEAEERFEYEEFDEYAAEELGDDLARRVLDPDEKVRSKADKELIELGLSPLEIMGEAYRSHDRSVTHHDDKIQELERRRRLVKADLDALQKARPADVQVIEG